jgi:hypothetical protein
VISGKTPSRLAMGYLLWAVYAAADLRHILAVFRRFTTTNRYRCRLPISVTRKVDYSLQGMLRLITLALGYTLPYGTDGSCNGKIRPRGKCRWQLDQWDRQILHFS